MHGNAFEAAPGMAPLPGGALRVSAHLPLSQRSGLGLPVDFRVDGRRIHSDEAGQ